MADVVQVRIRRREERVYRSRRVTALQQRPREKGNPKCLRKLYLSTKAGIESNISLLVEQAMERMMEQEQFSIGWEEA